MADLKMKINTTNDLRLKMKSNEIITMKFDDYQKFKEEDPIFKDSPAYTITSNDIYKWNHKSDFSGSYNDLRDKPNLSIYATKSELSSELSNKVDKVEGMGLSQNSFTTDEKNKLASLENYDDSEIITELNYKANISDIPTLTSDLTNDSGYITKDVDDLTYYPTNDSVNSIVALKQNIITSDNMLSAELVDDTSSDNKFVTSSDITTWNNKSDFSGDYSDLTNKPTIPVVDSSVSTTSTNAIENQAITNYVNNIGSSWVDKTRDLNINNSNINTNRTKLYVNEKLRLVFLQVYYAANISSTTISKPISYPITYKPAFADSDQLWFVMGASNGGSNTCRATLKYDSTNGTYIDIVMISGTMNTPYGNIMYAY